MHLLPRLETKNKKSRPNRARNRGALLAKAGSHTPRTDVVFGNSLALKLAVMAQYRLSRRLGHHCFWSTKVLDCAEMRCVLVSPLRRPKFLLCSRKKMPPIVPLAATFRFRIALNCRICVGCCCNPPVGVSLFLLQLLRANIVGELVWICW